MVEHEKELSDAIRRLNDDPSPDNAFVLKNLIRRTEGQVPPDLIPHLMTCDQIEKEAAVQRKAKNGSAYLKHAISEDIPLRLSLQMCPDFLSNLMLLQKTCERDPYTLAPVASHDGKILYRPFTIRETLEILASEMRRKNYDRLRSVKVDPSDENAIWMYTSDFVATSSDRRKFVPCPIEVLHTLNDVGSRYSSLSNDFDSTPGTEFGFVEETDSPWDMPEWKAMCGGNTKPLEEIAKTIDLNPRSFAIQIGGTGPNQLWPLGIRWGSRGLTIRRCQINYVSHFVMVSAYKNNEEIEAARALDQANA